MSLTEKHMKFIELDKKKALVKQFYEDYSKAVQDLINEYGVGHSFQDPDNTVYQIQIAEGRWVNFDKFEVNRTKRPGEERGSLSVKRAQELGYKV